MYSKIIDLSLQARLDEELNALRAKFADVELQEEEIARHLEAVEALTGQFDAEMLGFRNWLTGASSDPIWRTGVSRSPDAIERQLELLRKFRDTVKAKHSDLQSLEQLSTLLDRILIHYFVYIESSQLVMKRLQGILVCLHKVRTCDNLPLY